MNIFIVVSDHQWEGLDKILKVFSEKEKAEKYIKKFKRDHKKNEKRHKQIYEEKDANFYEKLKERGISIDDLPISEYYLIDDEFVKNLSEEDQYAYNYSHCPKVDSLRIIEMVVE